MGIITGLLERRSHEIKLNLKDPALIEIFGGQKSHSDVTVTEESAFNYSAFYAGVRVLAETLASLPLITYRRLPNGGKQRASGHFLYPLLHDLPNPEITSFELRETMMAHAVAWGNAYAEKVSEGGKLVELWPLTPSRVSPLRDPKTKELFYEVRIEDGEARLLHHTEVHHIRGLSLNGVTGLNTVSKHKETIGLALAEQEYAARFFSHDANPGGFLKHPKSLSDTAYNRLKAYWQEHHEGLSKKHRFDILEEGMDWVKVGVEPGKAQLLESRKFSVSEMARILRIPPHLVGDLERATFGNIEEQAIEFVIYTMYPWLRRWEQAHFRDLIPLSDRADIFTEFLIEGLLRGKTQERFSAYALGRQWGWLSADDILQLENRNPLPDGQGQIYLSPLNMVPASQIAESVDKMMRVLDRASCGESAEAFDSIKASVETFRSTLANLKLIALSNSNGHAAA